jgi:formylglycine-generating enzyme
MRKIILICIILTLTFAINALASEVIRVEKGTYVPFFRDRDEVNQIVGPFWVDKYAVTNQEFLNFVRSQRQWRKSQIKNIFAGEGYLEHWQSDLSFPQQLAASPVVNVSWFAARKYCQAQGKRLMSIAEWEYVSDSQNKENLGLILAWYSQPGDQIDSIASGKTNWRGVSGMHGLIWEWVEDFSSAIISGDSRSSNETSRSLFCGSGSLQAKDPQQYATFMRFAHRSSLKAQSVGRNLGFRCIHGEISKGKI